MTELFRYFHKQPKSRLIVLGFLTLALLGVVDHLAGPELFLSIFYFVPIFLVTWFTERRIGIMVSIASAIAWLLANYAFYALGQTSLRPAIVCWNMGIRLITFLLTSLILSMLKGALNHEKELARLDPLTGIANRRYFFELIEAEINRACRYNHSFTIVHIDLDNFKTVNDRFGHDTGDALLRSVAKGIQNNIRAIDIVVRLGGDEFVILLPETGPEPAGVITDKIQKISLDLMQKNQWPVTLSLGVVTFIEPPSTVDEMLKISDGLMYAAKNHGKNTIKYEVFGK
jgi:diguanylate cyclase (GGDEF)-like protein